MPPEVRASGRLYLGIFLISVAVLLLQLVYTRMFSFAVWYHFAYATISVALLGFGASGAILAMFPGLVGRDLEGRVAQLATGSALATLVGLALVRVTPFDPFEIGTDPAQWLYLTALYAAVLVPFFLAGLCVAMILSARPQSVGSLYFADLCGAGLGALLSIPVIDHLGAPRGVLAGGVLFALTAVALQPRWIPSWVVAVGLAAVLPFGEPLGPDPAPSKRLNDLLRDPGVEVVYSEWNAVARIDVAAWKDPNASRANGIWSTWGAIDQNLDNTPPQHTVAQDADAVTPMYRFRGDMGELDFLRDHILHLPYIARPQPPQVLVIGVGGGTDILTAVKFDAGHVTGVDINPRIVSILTEDFVDWNGGFFRDSPKVTLVVDEGRNYVRHADQQYDVIQINGVDTLAALSSGAYVLAESYLYTEEAILDLVARLSPDGILSYVIMDPVQGDSPPRHALRLFGVILQALERMGVEDPEAHVSVVGVPEPERVTRYLKQVLRGHNPIMPMSVIVKRQPFSADERQAIASFSADQGFTAWHVPGQAALSPFRDLTGGPEQRAAFFDNYFLDLHPTSDNKPFFFNFYKWRDLVGDLGYHPVRAAATGQMILLAMLGQALLLALLFIVLPLLVFNRQGLRDESRGALLLYFSALGFGFVFIEIPMIQRFVLFLGYPTRAFSVTLAALLISAGVGSLLTTRFASPVARLLPRIYIGVAGLMIAYLFVLPAVFEAMLGTSVLARTLTAVLLLAPLGLLLGMFFPIGIRSIGDPRFVAWAWGINGLTSVVGTVLAIVLAMNYGFNGVLLCALVIYGVGSTALFAARRAA